MLVVFEGPDGAGKSTTMKKVAAEFSAATTKEPGGTAAGKEIRKILFNYDLCREAELFLFMADRAQNNKENISEGLIFCDRYLASTLAYQNIFDVETVLEIFELATNARYPDLVFYFSSDKPHVVNGDRLEQRDERRKISERYEKIFNFDCYRNTKVIKIDTSAGEWGMYEKFIIEEVKNFERSD